MSFFKHKLNFRSQAEIDMERKVKEEEKKHQHWLLIEHNRKARERYEVKKISSWMYIGTFLGLLVAGIAGLMIWLSGRSGTTELWWVAGIGLVPLMLLGFISNIDDDWKASMAAKREIEKDITNSDDEYSRSNFGSSKITLNGFEYQYDYIYIDSVFKYWFYKLAKFVMGLSTVIFSILAIVLLFIWLGSISIAPTTIIIILLVWIILK
jgi:fatty acid desaturase